RRHTRSKRDWSSDVCSSDLPLPDETIALCENSDAVLLGAVGGPKWDGNPSELRPERGLLAIRKHFGLFANLRPVKAVPSLLGAFQLNEDVAIAVYIFILRKLIRCIFLYMYRELTTND